MYIKCVNCGKNYDFNKDETCPACGEYTKPNRNHKFLNQKSLNTSTNGGYRQQKVKPSSAYTSRRKERLEEEKNKKLSVSPLFSTIIAVVVFCLGAFNAILSDDEATYEEDPEVDTVLEEDEYFSDFVNTPVGSFQVNTVAEVEGDTIGEENKIIAIELEYKNNYEDRPENQEWEYLNNMYLEYYEDDENYISYSYDFTDSINDSYYWNLEYFDEYSVGESDYINGVMYFEIPKEVSELSLVIETVDYTGEEQTTRRFVAPFHYDETV